MTKEQATREALRMALEALEEAKLHIWLGDKKGVDANIKCHQTITAIKEALAQPEQEPTPTPNEGIEGSIRIFLKKSDGQWERLEKLEQVHEYNRQQWTQRTAAVGEDTRRAWVGLTDDDKKEYVAQDFGGNRLDAMDWAAQRLKEKNTHEQ